MADIRACRKQEVSFIVAVVKRKCLSVKEEKRVPLRINALPDCVKMFAVSCDGAPNDPGLLFAWGEALFLSSVLTHNFVLAEAEKRYDYKRLEMEEMPEPVHLLLSVNPQV